MSFKYSRTLNRPRPLAKPLKFQEFRQRYLVFMSLYLGAGILPALAWIQLGRSYEAIYVEVFGYCALFAIAALSFFKIFHLYEGRLQSIYPQIKKFNRKELRKFRLLLEISTAVPILNLSILGALFLCRKTVRKTPYFITHPLQSAGLVGTVFLIPLFSFVLGAAGFSSTPMLPRSFSFWASPPSVSTVSNFHHDVGQTLVWGSYSKKQIAKEKLNPEETNNLLSKKVHIPEIRSSPIAPLMLSFVAVGAHHISNKNSRSPSSDSQKYSHKAFILEHYVEILKNWQPSLLYSFNPVAFLNPLNVYEFILTSVAIRGAHAYMKEEFHRILITHLDRLQAEIANDATSSELKVKVNRLKNEVIHYEY